MIVKTSNRKRPVFGVLRSAGSTDNRAIGSSSMMKWFILIASFWAFQASAQTTYPATSCSQIAVSAAILAEQVHPVDGDIISIPAGTCTWPLNTGINKTFTNSVTIQGAGAVSSTANGAGTTGTDQTVLLLTGTSALFNITTTAGKSFRLTGIAFEGQTGEPALTNGLVHIGGTSTAVRVDHCHFHVPASVQEGIIYAGAINGVGDHDYFTTDASFGVLNAILFLNGELWGGHTNAHGSWADSSHWGTSQFIFQEDSRFVDVGVTDMNNGARLVFRHNNVVCDSSAVDQCQMYSHGIATGLMRGFKEAEVYLNTWNSTAPADTGAIQSLNSGSELFCRNTATGTWKAMLQTSYNFRNQAGGGGNYSYPPPSAGWGYCGSAAGGPTNWDGNNNTTNGYPCLGQPGRGKGDLLSGTTFAALVNSTTGTVAWPHEQLTPLYSWMNRYTSTHYGGVYGALSNGVPTNSNNVDFFYECGAVNGFTNPSCPSGFTGATGTGYGLLSARPSTCTGNTDPMTGGAAPGVAYWATDTNTLYVCNPTNTWTVYYTPYTYPHPLVAGGTTGTGVSPPAALTATVQ